MGSLIRRSVKEIPRVKEVGVLRNLGGLGWVVKISETEVLTNMIVRSLTILFVRFFGSYNDSLGTRRRYQGYHDPRHNRRHSWTMSGVEVPWTVEGEPSV